MYYPRRRVYSYAQRPATSYRTSGTRGGGRYVRRTVTTRSNYGRGRLSSRLSSRASSSAASSSGSNPNQIFRVSQLYDTQFTSSTSVPVTGAIYFALSQLDQAASFTAIFDQWRIRKVTLTARPRVTQAVDIATSIGAMIYEVVDYDDATPLTTIGDARQFQTCREHGPYEAFTRVFRPHAAVGAYAGATFNGYSNVSNQWFDTASPAVQHYGFKSIVAGTTKVQTWDFAFKIDYEFKNVH